MFIKPRAYESLFNTFIAGHLDSFYYSKTLRKFQTQVHTIASRASKVSNFFVEAEIGLVNAFIDIRNYIRLFINRVKVTR